MSSRRNIKALLDKLEFFQSTNDSFFVLSGRGAAGPGGIEIVRVVGPDLAARCVHVH